ncbi:MAG TPA: type III-B CRISPR module RAMP protein Cmr6, partial [Verrucomicrobiae bacterium]|nr:type III-B CRISPR module RAMP protein Cmr6 [Verrucomicrobiae bacterium]
MLTLMPTDTRDTLGPNAEKCDSRSLLLDRFVDATAKKDARKSIFTRAFNKPSIRNKAISWPPFLTNGVGLKLDDLLFGKLQARLMVNMAGGVMENAGLCLDRFGIPYIPGSAVKGCARRMAIQQLFESGAGFQPPQPEDITAKSKRWEQCAELLVQIARVFGWGDLDWSHKQKDGRFISDFAYASGDADWEEIRERAAKLLFAAFPNWKPDPKKPLWQSLPNFAGSVSFLPAYPVQAPNPDLELDVVTCHHREYYAGNPQFADAPDTEEPVPVVFPAVAPGHVFVFAIVPLRGCDAALLNQARAWLKAGLETFGLGAKTNAGYGWFDCSEAVQNTGQEAV